jgi:hypothetical protein
MSDEEIQTALRDMIADSGLLTASRTSVYSIIEGEMVSFIDKHTSYLQGHPKVNPQQYLTNLRTMIKIR